MVIRRLLPEVPASPAVPSDPPGTLRAAQEASGLNLDGKTLHQSWTGEPFDVGWAIDVRHPFATGKKEIEQDDDEDETGSRR